MERFNYLFRSTKGLTLVAISLISIVTAVWGTLSGPMVEWGIRDITVRLLGMDLSPVEREGRIIMFNSTCEQIDVAPGGALRQLPVVPDDRDGEPIDRDLPITVHPTVQAQPEGARLETLDRYLDVLRPGTYTPTGEVIEQALGHEVRHKQDHVARLQLLCCQ